MRPGAIQGFAVAKCTVRRLMRQMGLRGATRGRAFTVTTIPDEALARPGDLVERDFTAAAPNLLWIADITYVPTSAGFVYVAFVTDVHSSRRILGMSMASHIRTQLVADALEEAVGTRGGDVTGVVMHSDRGTQYTSNEYAELCARHGIAQSVGRTGVCWDNAPAESFLATLKKELVHRRMFRTRAEARLAIRHWIESWYNRRRLHSSLGGQSPIEWENNYRHTTNTLAA
jgi:transposase InsO family protein